MSGCQFCRCRPRKWPIPTYIHGPMPFQRGSIFPCMFTFAHAGRGKREVDQNLVHFRVARTTIVGGTSRRRKKTPKSSFSQKDLKANLDTPTSGNSSYSCIHPSVRPSEHTYRHPDIRTFISSIRVLRHGRATQNQLCTILPKSLKSYL